VEPKYVHYATNLVPNDEGGWGVHDHLTYYAIAPGHVVTAEIPFPWPPSQMMALVQHRDMLERNYRSVLHMTESSGRYAADAEIGRLQERPRLDLFLVAYRAGEWSSLADESTVAKWMSEDRSLAEFISYWDASVSVGFLRDSYIAVEDRGDWSRL
jgi:hypothetical protein